MGLHPATKKGMRRKAKRPKILGFIGDDFAACAHCAMKMRSLAAHGAIRATLDNAPVRQRELSGSAEIQEPTYQLTRPGEPALPGKLHAMDAVEANYCPVPHARTLGAATCVSDREDARKHLGGYCVEALRIVHCKCVRGWINRKPAICGHA